MATIDPKIQAANAKALANWRMYHNPAGPQGYGYVAPKTTAPKVGTKLPTSPKTGNKVSLAKSGSGGAVDMDALDAAQAQQDYALGLSTPVPVPVNTVSTQTQPLDFDMSGNRGALAFGGSYTDSAGNTVNAMPAGDNWWTENKDMIGGIAQGIQAGAGLANAYLGYKNYGLAKDQFKFAKAAANRDIANQAQLINNEIQNAGEVGMSLAGNTMSPEQRAARQQQLNAMRVSGAPIG